MRALPTQILLGLVLLLGGALPASAHAPPPLVLLMDLDEEALRVEITMSGDLFRDWVTSLLADEAAVVTVGLPVERSARFLAEAFTVEADGLVVRPVVEKVVSRPVDVHGQQHLFVDVTARYGMKGRLRSLGLAWTKYENGVGAGVSPIDTELSAYGRTDYPVFTSKEPGYTWHAPLEPRADRVEQTPGVSDVPTTAYPVLSFGLLLVLLVLLPILLVRGARRATLLATVAVTALAAFLLRGVEVRLPDVHGFRMPSEAEAGRIFESLHRNVYRAFDYDTEDAVYETLAQSVEGELLDEVYAEVYQSLILGDQGGAVCTIQKTQILQNDVELPEDDDARAFHTTCRWRVRGKVGHWGHTHIRVNEYRARYRVRHRGDAWRIAGVEILEQRRVER